MGGILGKYKEHRDQSMKRNTNHTPMMEAPVKPKKRDGKKSQSPDKSINEPVHKTTGWTNMTLSVPVDPLAELKSQIVDEPPVPPPRKRYNKTATLERQKVVVNLEKTAADVADYSNRVPVEEPLIVPKKEPVHICDGTHHHVCNTHAHNHVGVRTASLTDVDAKSKVSVPNHVVPSVSRTEPPTRNVSVTSLPPDAKIVLSDATAARLESYMQRCKSFDKLQLSQKQMHDDHSDSEDSWEGMRISDEPLKSPVQPKCRLEFPTSDRTQPKIVLEKPADDQTEPPVQLPLKLPHTNLMKEIIAERRESIDDFFDAAALSPFSQDDGKASLGRRGSDAFFPPPKEPIIEVPTVPIDKNSLLSSIHYTKALIDVESTCYRKHKAVEAPKVIESDMANDDLMETIMEFYDTHKNLSRGPESELADGAESEIAKSNNEAPVLHSNLLKIIQENTKIDEDKDDDEVDTDMKFYIPEPLRSALVDLDQKINQIDAEKQQHHTSS